MKKFVPNHVTRSDLPGCVEVSGEMVAAMIAYENFGKKMAKPVDPKKAKK